MHDKRYLATLLIEAETPLAVGSGESDITTDHKVTRDFNGLPMIPGTSICGVLRHSLLEASDDDDWCNTINDIFGYQEGDDGTGSRLIVTDALMIGKDGRVHESVGEVDPEDAFYRRFFTLPVRQHCRINYRGAADTEGHGKFDEEVVYKGTRFLFEIELAGTDADKDAWVRIISMIRSPLFRIGGGTRKGFGAIRVAGADEQFFDLKSKEGLEGYLALTSSLAARSVTCTNDSHYRQNDGDSASTWNVKEYALDLEPEDFFIFGSGYGDDAADIRPVIEPVIKWENGMPEFSEDMALIPASSVKGAISHRVTFHYNRLKGVYADKIYPSPNEKIEDHEDVKATAAKMAVLFGSASGDNGTGERGGAIFSDILVSAWQEKIMNHVAIDRFTGGAIQGALFSERVFAETGQFAMSILVEKSAFNNNHMLQEAFEHTLLDIVTGMLPLGGGVMRGHGIFRGSVRKREGGGKWTVLSD